MIGSGGVSVCVTDGVIVRVAEGRSVQVGREVRVMVGVAVNVPVTAGVRVVVTVGGRKVEVGRERDAAGKMMRSAMKIKKKTTSMSTKAGSKDRGEDTADFMSMQIIPEKERFGT